MAPTAAILTAFGTVIASRMGQVESFQVVMRLIVLPMFFLSGAVFPLTGCPAGWPRSPRSTPSPIPSTPCGGRCSTT
jgi:ABC-type multidrug transport system permease subunit